MTRPRRLTLVASGAAVTLAAAAAFALAVPDASAATNTIANPGFETGTLSSWTCDATDSVVGSPVH